MEPEFNPWVPIHFNSVIDLKKAEFDINSTKVCKGKTYSLISYAIKYNVSEELFLFLLEKKPNLNCEGVTPFEECFASKYCSKFLPHLLNAGLNATQKWKDNTNILEHSFKNRNLESCKIIIEYCKEKELFDEIFKTTTETTFIHIGAYINDMDVVMKGLESHKVRVNDLSLEPPLLFAVRNRNESIIKLLVQEANANINIVYKDESVTSIAVANYSQNILKLVVDLGASVNLPTLSLNNPLLLSFLQHNENLFRNLIEFGATFETLYHFGMKDLHINCFLRNKDEVIKELDNGGDINEVFYLQNNIGNDEEACPVTPLVILVASGNLELFSIVLERGIKLSNLSGVLCLLFAGRESNEIFNKVIEAGGRDLIRYFEDQIQILDKKYIEGEDVKTMYAVHYHPLMTALENNDKEKVLKLLELGCNLDREYLARVDHSNIIKVFPIQYAFLKLFPSFEGKEIFLSLLKYKPNPNVGRNISASPLKIAVGFHFDDIVDSLLDIGADPNYIEEQAEDLGANPLDINEYYKKMEDVYTEIMPTAFHVALNGFGGANIEMIKKIFKYPRKLIAPSLILCCENLEFDILLWLIENKVELFDPWDPKFVLKTESFLRLFITLLPHPDHYDTLEKIIQFYARAENSSSINELIPNLITILIEKDLFDHFNFLLLTKWKDNVMDTENISKHFLVAMKKKKPRFVERILEIIPDPLLLVNEKVLSYVYEKSNDFFERDDPFYKDIFRRFIKLKVRAPKDALNWAIKYLFVEDNSITLEILDLPGIDLFTPVKETYYPYAFVDFFLYSVTNRIYDVIDKILSILSDDELKSYFDKEFVEANFMHLACANLTINQLGYIIERGGSLFLPLDSNNFPPIVRFIDRYDFKPFIKHYLNEIFIYTHVENEFVEISRETNEGVNIYNILKLNRNHSVYSHILGNLNKYQHVLQYLLELDRIEDVIYSFPVDSNRIGFDYIRDTNDEEIFYSFLKKYSPTTPGPENTLIITRSPLDFILEQSNFFAFTEELHKEQFHQLAQEIMTYYNIKYSNIGDYKKLIEILHKDSCLRRHVICIGWIEVMRSKHNLPEVYDYIFQKVVAKYTRFDETDPPVEHIVKTDLPHKSNVIYRDYLRKKTTEAMLKALNLQKESLPKHLLASGNYIEYLYELAQGRQKVKKLRVVIVGPAAAGKTTIVKNLIGEQRWSGTELDHYKEFYEGWNAVEVRDKKKKRKGVTDGIDVHQWVPDNTDVEISLWDFAGQEIYYTTHQFFLSAGTLYLIVFDVVKPLREGRILYWLNSIQSRVEGQFVVIVGTHADLLKPNERESKLKEISNELQQVYRRWVLNFPATCSLVNIIQNKAEGLMIWPVGTKDMQSKLKDVEATIIENAAIKELVPTRYIELLQQIVKERSKVNPPILDLTEIMKLAEQEKLDHESTKQALGLFHEWGEVLYFGNTKNATFHLQQRVCINPKWLSDVFKTITSFKHIDTTGKYQSLVTKKDLEERWRSVNFPEIIFPYLIELLERQFQIIVALPKSIKNQPNIMQNDNTITYLIPSLLSPDLNIEIWQPLHVKKKQQKQKSKKRIVLTSDDYVNTNVEYFREYRLTFTPHGMFSRLLVHLLLLEEDSGISILHYWRNGIIFFSEEDKILCQVKIVEDGTSSFGRVIVITIRGETAKWKGMMVRIHSIILDMLTNWYTGLSSRVIMNVGYNSLTKGLFQILYEECVEQFLAMKDNLSREKFDIFSELLPELSMPIISWKKGEIEDRDLFLSEEQFNRDVVIGQKLGNGMFGNVYKGSFKGQIVAIKTLSNQNPSDHDLLDFCKEIGMLSALDNPYIVKLFYFFPRPMAIITEFVPGGDLQGQLEKRPACFTWNVITKIMLDMARGLAHMHSLNPPILHCDLKSANILVIDIEANEPNIAVKLGDVGCARLANHHGQSGEDSIATEVNGYLEIVKELFKIGDSIYSPIPPLLNEIFSSLIGSTIPSPIFQNLVKRLERIVNDETLLSKRNFFKKLQLIETINQLISENKKMEIFELISKDDDFKNNYKVNRSLKNTIQNLLSKTVIEGDFHYFKSLIDCIDIDVNDQFNIPKNKSINRILQLSVRYGKYEITELILEKGGDPNFPTNKGFSPLHICSIYNQPQLIGLLIQHGGSVNSLSPIKSTPMISSITKAHFDCTREFLRSCVSADTGNSYFYFHHLECDLSPLLVAITLKNSKDRNSACKLLLEFGASFPSLLLSPAAPLRQKINESEEVRQKNCNYLYTMGVELITELSDTQSGRSQLSSIHSFLSTCPIEGLKFIIEALNQNAHNKYRKSRLVNLLSSRNIIEPPIICHTFTSSHGNETFSTTFSLNNNYTFDVNVSLIVAYTNKAEINFNYPSFYVKARSGKQIKLEASLNTIEKSITVPVIVEINGDEKFQYFIMPIILSCSEELLQQSADLSASNLFSY